MGVSDEPGCRGEEKAEVDAREEEIHLKVFSPEWRPQIHSYSLIPSANILHVYHVLNTILSAANRVVNKSTQTYLPCGLFFFFFF